MKKKKILNWFLFAVFFINLFTITASANSSWYWISSRRPLDLLPIVIVVTLLIEIFAVNCKAEVKEIKRVVLVVSIANLVSFLIPYIWLGIDPYNVYSLLTKEEGLFYAINYSVEHGPVFTVSVFFLILTLLVETPIVYLYFKNRVENKKKLISTIIVANIITTGLTFVIERIFCHGEW